jgi:hypothetical protein
VKKTLTSARKANMSTFGDVISIAELHRSVVPMKQSKKIIIELLSFSEYFNVDRILTAVDPESVSSKIETICIA